MIHATLDDGLADRYRIERKLGQGGMATVYLAEDLKHGRKVAIKVLRPELAAMLGTERFLSEIRTTAALQHPHIVPLFDSGTVEVASHESRVQHESGPSRDSPLVTLLYFVMPFIDGESLRERLVRDRTVPVEEALRLAAEVADALAYAHAHDVIHRDIKPENILLQSGHAIVADFGIARAVSAAGSERMTMTGLAMGTPAYMSPEQSAGDPDLDGRSDLYGLACVLYEMLAGEPAFAGPTMDAILVQRFTKPAPRLSRKLPAVAPAIDSALATAMARAREERFATLEQFAQALKSRGQPARPGGHDPSIAVLPFANMSGDPENEYFSDGISEEIINALAQLPGLRVAARTSAFSFKGTNTDLRSVGEQLSVATVLEGSVRKAGGRIRITAQLIDVADGYHLWSERYDRELTDVFAIQDEIATAIAGKLKVTLRVGESGRLVRPPTANVAAYELYLKGLALNRQRGPALWRAVEAYEEAIALDPGLAQAHAELAQSLMLMALYGLAAPVDIRERSRSATARALELAPDLAVGRLSEALLFRLVEFEGPKASDAFARTVELDPLNVDARSLRAAFDLCYFQGDFAAAEAELADLIEIDPRNSGVRGQMALTLGFAGRTDEAAAQARQGIELDPGAFYPHWGLIHALMLGPRPADAIAFGRSILGRFARHPWLLFGLAYASGAAGERDAAEGFYLELAARARGEYIQPMALAISAIGAGKQDLVYRHLREAATTRDPLLTAMALHWPGLRSLRGSAEFAQVLELMGWGEGSP